MGSQAQVSKTAVVDPGAVLDDNVTVWNFAHIRGSSRIGSGSSIGEGVHIGASVVIGRNVKVQDHALVYEPALIEDGVFLGPAVVLTNDEFPRAVTPSGERKSTHDWVPVGVTVRRGASIGARAVCVAPVEIGAWAMVGAGAVVTRDVTSHALVVGAPARQIGWVGRAGRRLKRRDTTWVCDVTGEVYSESDGRLTLIT